MPCKLSTMLALDDPRYLRRLTREINQQRSGVYLSAAIAKTESNPRLCGRASFSESEQVIRFPACEGAEEEVVHKVTPAQAGEAFMEGGRGDTIYASREER